MKSKNTALQDVLWFLKNRGFETYLDLQDDGRWVFFQGRGTYGAATTAFIRTPFPEGFIYADNAEAFDKIGSCPIRCSIFTKPSLLYSRLLYWGTKEGYEKSNRFDYDELLNEEDRRKEEIDV